MRGQHIGTHVKIDPQLVGEPSEVKILLNGLETLALCDTGFCVSTCSEKYYSDHLAHIQLQPISNI
jgi:hypothetical protein